MYEFLWLNSLHFGNWIERLFNGIRGSFHVSLLTGAQLDQYLLFASLPPVEINTR